MIQIRTPALALSGFLLAASAQAQSTMQCVLNASGEYEAPLIWQNTLGVKRANDICRGQAMREAAQQPVSGAVSSAAAYAPTTAVQVMPPAATPALSVPAPMPADYVPLSVAAGAASPDYQVMWTP